MSTTPNSDKICEFFALDVLYRIPIYQRRYVWDTDNWETLWKDIKENSNKNSKGYPQSHFTGAIVTREIEEIGGENLTVYEVIDGQQRLTTFQIIFSALRFLCNQMEEDIYDIAGELKGYLVLEPSHGGDHKLRLTEYDQGAFKAVVLNNLHVPSVIGRHKIYKAYKYFLNEITDYVDSDYTKLHNLYTSITNNFHVVQIEAGVDDESQRIFETLNATGRRLSEFDYLRNNLFLRVGTDPIADTERTRLYQEYWTEFETHYNEWSDDKLESFLSDFLLAKYHSNNREGLRTFDLYRQYSETLDPSRGQNLEYEIRQLGNYGEVYRRMNDASEPIGIRMQFYKDLDISDVCPFILYVISELRPDTNNIDRFFSILESYIVQSMLVDGAPYYKKIQSFFDRIKVRGHTFLQVEHFQKSLVWPSREQLEEALRNAGTKNAKLIRYVLYRIECLKRAKEPNVDMPVENPSFDSLQSLEHVMPESWQVHWPLDSTEGETPEDLYFIGLYTKLYKKRNPNWRDTPSREGLATRNERYLHAHKLALERIKTIQSIGNLTPLSVALNRNFAHDLFSDKRTFFLNHPAGANSVLTREIFHQNQNWDAQQIRDREADLLRSFFQIWPIVEI